MGRGDKVTVGSAAGSPTGPAAKDAGAFPEAAGAAAGGATGLAAAVKLAVEKATAAKSDSGAAVKTLLAEQGLPACAAAGLTNGFDKLLSSKTVPQRVGALQVATAMMEVAPAVAYAHLIVYLPQLLDCVAHRSPEVRTPAQVVVDKLAAAMVPPAVMAITPVVIEAVKGHTTKAAALKFISTMTAAHPNEIADQLPTLIPAIVAELHDMAPAVKTAAYEALTAVADKAPSPDIVPFIPQLVSCVLKPDEAQETVFKIAATTFVKTMTAPTLAILEPVLVRALADGKSAVARMCAVIVENMAKLVPTPVDASVFVRRVLPGMTASLKRIPQPEARAVIQRAIDALVRANGGEAVVEPAAHINSAEVAKVVAEAMNASLLPAVQSAIGSVSTGREVMFIAGCCEYLVAAGNLEGADWEAALKPIVSAYCAEPATVIKAILKACATMAVANDPTLHFEDDDASPDLCNCVFSLAYGSKVLLRDTRLHLKRGRRYGLIGPNGSGKSTLMRSICAGQIDGFPSKEELRTVFVECDISPDAAEMTILEFVKQDAEIAAAKIEEAEIVKALQTVGFSDAMIVANVGTLSGGWRMKLALARAMLKNADILLLDEPTNHLDVANVAWVLNYLQNLKDVTSLIVSHDAKFLDAVSTDVIQCDHFKLRNFRGNVSAFVQAFPEAKAYQELKASATLKFEFPEPSAIHGVKTRGKKLLQMTDVEFTYPGTTRKILHGVSIVVSRASRCAVIGPNGAGKSTMIKLLTGEMEPSVGTVWRHPALSLAYVAQHAFHHIENHLTKTPSEYIIWRFDGGVDKEAISKGGLELSEADQAKMAEVKTFNGVKHRLIALLGRKTHRKAYVYEARWEIATDKDGKTWVKKPMEEGDPLAYLPREMCEQYGWGKVVQDIDLRAEAAHGTRLLSVKEVEKHLGLLGLEPEFANHCRIESLSMSQRVKVVLAAATWDNPHIIVLDEPTNYLDRESLGALADAIRSFGGGVVMISHNDEFTSALCSEQWAMKDGKLTVHGEVPQENDGKLDEKMFGETTLDRFGNEVKAAEKSVEQMSRKERMQREKMRKRMGAGSDEDDM